MNCDVSQFPGTDPIFFYQHLGKLFLEGSLTKTSKPIEDQDNAAPNESIPSSVRLESSVVREKLAMNLLHGGTIIKSNVGPRNTLQEGCGISSTLEILR